VFHTYILASKRNGTIYVGSTDSLERRVWEHREKVRGGFTAKYGVTRLVWFEAHDTREGAFRRERRIKGWRRSWKLTLIETGNPTWRDLFDELWPEPDVEGWLAALDAPQTTAHPGECRDPDRMVKTRVG
jgi:putative endonuclease